ncbi:CD109 antigen-like protein, partial [Leptotrombidium deliense]
TPITTDVVMESDGGFDFVVAESEENEISFLENSKTKTVTTSANDGITVAFLIKPKKVGYMKIKVTATSETESDGLVEKLLIKPEGETHYENKASLVTLKEGETFEESVEIKIPDNIVQDSERVSFTVIGDILGPAVNNLDDLLRMPYGCGEQNMINFVPNIVALEYLNKAHKMIEKIKTKAISN